MQKHDKNKRAPRKGSLACLLITGAMIATNAHSEALLNPNQINGKIRFTNHNNDIVNLLQSKGINYGYIRADSLGITPALNNYASVYSSNPQELNFQMTVESSETGITYQVTPELRLDNHGDRYLIDGVTSAPVYPEPNADTEIAINQCASVLDVRFVDEQGQPVSVTGGDIRAYKETQPGSGSFRLQAHDFGLNSGVSNEQLAVNGDGSLYRVDVFYDFGADAYSDKLRNMCQKQVTASCDTVVPVVCAITPGSQMLGSISGNIDVEGEPVQDVNYFTRIHGYDGPFGNSRLDKVAGSGTFNLANLVPSDAANPNRDYRVYGEMILRKGYQTQYLRTPMLDYINGRVPVTAGKNTDLADTFVLKPGYVNGKIELVGPPGGANGSALADIYRDADRDNDQNGLPDSLWMTNSHAGAYGSYTKASGAQYGAFGAIARAGFSGDYNSDTSRFEGQYEMVLGGLKGESSIWTPGHLVLRLLDMATPNIPETYQNAYLSINNLAPGTREVSPGSQASLDHSYCFNEVSLSYKSLAGTFYNPQASANGTFNGEDFTGQMSNYQVYLNWAYGTPRSAAAASNRGMVHMVLPQGQYNITPKVTAINPNGSQSNAELPPVSIDVGCGQVVQMATDIQISLGDLPQETAEEILKVTGNMNSEAAIKRVEYEKNEKAPIIVCQDDCGTNGQFSAEIPLDEGDNIIVVTATNELGSQASVTARVTYSAPEPVEPLVLKGCDDINLDIEPDVYGANIDFSISSEGGYGEIAQSCDSASGSFFGLGTTTVSCNAIDSAGQTAQCDFDITVSAQTAEVEDCTVEDGKAALEHTLDTGMLWPPNHELTTVGFERKINNCDQTFHDNLVTEVWSDETEVPEKGDGSGKFAPDAKQQDGLLKLRKERRGTEDGRVYLIISKTSDATNNQFFTCSTVVVPHDKSKASKAEVNEQAKAAKEYCEMMEGQAPYGYSQHGVSEEIGPKQ